MRLLIFIMFGGFLSTRVAGNTVYLADAGLFIAAMRLLLPWLIRPKLPSPTLTSLFVAYYALSIVVGMIVVPGDFITLGIKEHITALRALIAVMWALHVASLVPLADRGRLVERMFWLLGSTYPIAHVIAVARPDLFPVGALDNVLVFLIPCYVYFLQDYLMRHPSRRVFRGNATLLVIGGVLVVVGLAFAYTRSALLGGFVGAGTILALGPVLRRLSGRAVAFAGASLVVAAAGVAVVTTSDEVAGARRIRAIVDSSAAGYGNEGRFAIWADALRTATEPRHLLTGVGVHNYVFASQITEVKDNVVVVPGLKSDTIKQGHNHYLTFLVELGLIGLGIFVMMVGNALRAAIGDPHGLLWVALLGAFLAMSLTADFLIARAPYHLQVSLVFWLLYGLIVRDQPKRVGVLSAAFRAARG